MGRVPRIASRLRRFPLSLFLLLSLALPPAVAASPPASGTAEVFAPAVPRNDLPGLRNFAKVSDELYRGEQPTAEGFRTLKAMGVRTVVSLRGLHSDRKLLAGTGLRYRRIVFHTWHPEDADVVLFLKVFADPANLPVFVHCMHGADRTGMMTALYRMARQGWPRDRAIAELPSFGFHEMWKGVRKYLKNVDIKKITGMVRAAPPVAVDVVK